MKWARLLNRHSLPPNTGKGTLGKEKHSKLLRQAVVTPRKLYSSILLVQYLKCSLSASALT